MEHYRSKVWKKNVFADIWPTNGRKMKNLSIGQMSVLSNAYRTFNLSVRCLSVRWGVILCILWMTLYDHAQLCLPTYDFIRPYKCMYNFLWQYMTVYDFVLFLPCPTLSDCVLHWMTLYDLIQPFITLYDYVWLNWTLCASIWPFMTWNASFGIGFY